MKNGFALKTLGAAIALTTSFAVHASPFYLDGPDSGPDEETPVAYSGPIGQASFVYNSQSVVYDTNLDGVLSAGDKIESYGGIEFDNLTSPFPSPLNLQGYDSINDNAITGFVPTSALTSVIVNEDYNIDWVLTFGFSDLEGVFNGSDFVYNPGGVITMYAWDLVGGTSTAIFDMILTSGGPSGGVGEQAQDFHGTVDFSNTTGNTFMGMNVEDIFFIEDPSGTIHSFYDWNVANPGFEVKFETDQTVTGGPTINGANQATGVPSSPSDIVFQQAGGATLLAANHTGRASFEVPEPGSIALLGLGLLGLSAASRRNKK